MFCKRYQQRTLVGKRLNFEMYYKICMVSQAKNLAERFRSGKLQTSLRHMLAVLILDHSGPHLKVRF